MKKVLFLYGDSLSNVLEHTGRSFASTFLQQGIELIPLRMSGNRSFRSELDDCLEEDVEYAFGLAGAGFGLRTDQDDEESPSLWEFMKVPHLAGYGDTPAYAFDLHRQLGRYSVSLYTFAEHLALRKELPFISGVLGRAPPVSIIDVDRSAINFEKKKTGRIVFLKNGGSATQLMQLWERSLRPGTARHLKNLSDQVRAELHLERPPSVQQYVEAYLTNLGIEHLHVARLKLLFISQIDDFLRRLKSELVADVMLDYPTEVRGVGWGHLNSTNRVGKLIERCDYVESVGLIKDALAIVDMSPNTDGGFHDRQARAAGSFTLCLSNTQSFLESQFANAREFTYAFTRKGIASQIESVLANPASSVDLGISVSEKFHQQADLGTGLKRLTEIAELVKDGQMDDRLEGAPPYLMWPPTTF